MLRILFLTTWFPYPPDNGSKLRVYHLLRALTASYRVTLLSFVFSSARPQDALELNIQCEAVHTVDIDPFAFNRAGTLATFLSPRPMASRPIPAMQHLAAAVFSEASFDAVVASTGMMADYALQAPKATVRVLEEHNAMTRWAQERYRQAMGWPDRVRGWLSWRKSRAYEARLYRKFDLITMVSQADCQAARDIINSGYPPVAMIPNGVDCVHNRPESMARRQKSLVFNGSLTYSANHDAMQWFLSQVWPSIRRQAPDITLTITGSTVGVDLAGLALDDHVRLIGYVEDVRVPVAEANIAIAPIRQGGGTRLKILEAMALGTPVVATSKAAEGLEVTPNEHLLIADDADSFVAAILWLLNDTALQQHLSVSARQLVETHYDWGQIGLRFVALLEDAVEHKGNRHV